jgi:hypothetical protein
MLFIISVNTAYPSNEIDPSVSLSRTTNELSYIHESAPECPSFRGCQGITKMNMDAFFS